MQLSQPEMIQILRKRASLNQAELGSRAFGLNMDSGRTKIKNIELGRQRATEDDLRRIAECLQVPVEQLLALGDNGAGRSRERPGGVIVPQKVIDMFPGLGNYLQMLENAAGLEDAELIAYLTAKIGDILRGGPVADASAPAAVERGAESG